MVNKIKEGFNNLKLEEKAIVIAVLVLAVFLTSVFLYKKEQWSVYKKPVKENIDDADILYVYEYKYYSFKDGKWMYIISTPTTRRTRYYVWDKDTNVIVETKPF